MKLEGDSKDKASFSWLISYTWRELVLAAARMLSATGLYDVIKTLLDDVRVVTAVLLLTFHSLMIPSAEHTDRMSLFIC